MAMKERAGGRILSQAADGIGRITFNQPEKLNAMSLDMWAGLHAALDEFSADAEVRVVVLTGAGGRAFVSGADISEFESQRSGADAVANYNRIFLAADAALYDFPKPTIAAIRGVCVGGGMGLAAGCDIRICTEGARLGITAARLGLGYGLDGTRRLVDLVGPSVAAEVLYSANLFDAGQAHTMGLVNRVVADDALEGEVDTLAARIAANAPLTVATAKAAIRAASRPSADDAARIAGMVDACYASADYAEGRRAFTEKRKPVFRGE